MVLALHDIVQQAGVQFSTARGTSAYILMVEQPDDGRRIQSFQSGKVFFAAEEIPAQGEFFILVP